MNQTNIKSAFFAITAALLLSPLASLAAQEQAAPAVELGSPFLDNAMFHPVIPYACRGVVWYQGEANATHPAEYAQSLPLWVKRLRREWGRDDLEMLVVMLPGFGKDDGSPGAKSWAWFREAQKQVETVPHAALVNTIDLGDAANIHPPDKAPAADRLALMARHEVYGGDVVARGPVYQSHEGNGESIIHLPDRGRRSRSIIRLRAPARPSRLRRSWLWCASGAGHPFRAPRCRPSARSDG